jgi:O-methyltransferase
MYNMALHPFLIKTNLYKHIGKVFKPSHKVYKYMVYLDFVKEHRELGQINDYYNKDSKYCNRYQLYDSIISDLRNTNILYYEFGVADGDMIRYWSTQNQSSGSKFVGFDSFEGLPESWEDKKEDRHFDQKGNFPDIKDSRVKFVKGWFQDSV